MAISSHNGDPERIRDSNLESQDEDGSLQLSNTSLHTLEFNRATEGRVHQLARTFSNMSAASESRPTVINPFQSRKDSSLDPSFRLFDAEHWLKAYISVIHNDAERYPQRTTGVSYRDVNVYGFGSEMDYQKDVFNIFFHAINIAKEMFRDRPRIPILTSFDGLVRPGEMCVVLGRPRR